MINYSDSAEQQNCRQNAIRAEKKLKAIKIRAVRLVSPDGVVSVLLTSLYNQDKFDAQGIIWLYFRRGEIEGYYRDEKTILEIEKFHCKTPNSIRHELFAVMIMTVITRTMMILSSDFSEGKKREPQFRHAIDAIASEAVILVPEKAAEIFTSMLEEIARVRFHRAKHPRPSKPRVSKKPINKFDYHSASAIESMVDGIGGVLRAT